MTASSTSYVAAIAEHSLQFAEVANGNFNVSVPHCPGWNVADVVLHLVSVHWLWSTIVNEQLLEPPDDSRRPPAPARTALVATFLDGADRLVQVLSSSDQDAPVWTWAPNHNTVAFVTRHQVQEIVVHHWDVANAVGRPFVIAPAVATDAIEEFLTVSVSSDVDPADPPAPALGGSFGLRCTDADAAWTIRDGAVAGTTLWVRGLDDSVPVLESTASDALLWLYGRAHLSSDVPNELLKRFRALSFTN